MNANNIRKKERSKLHFNAPVGIASILLIFMTLCLISFASLSLASASADMKLSQKLADHCSAYYNAYSQAQDFIADTDAALALSLSASKTENEYYQKAGSVQTQACFDISDIQSLHVVLSPHYPDSSDKMLFHIQTMQVITDDSDMVTDSPVPVR